MSAPDRLAPWFLGIGSLGLLVTVYMALGISPTHGRRCRIYRSRSIQNSVHPFLPFAWVSFTGFALLFGGSPYGIYVVRKPAEN